MLSKLQKKDWQGILIFGIGLAILGTMAGIYIYVTGLPKIDPKTLCHPEHLPQKHIIFLIDKTDQLTLQQEEVVEKIILDQKLQMDRYDKLSLNLITPDPEQSVKELFSLCNPGTRKSANFIKESKTIVQRFFDKHFDKPLRQNLDVVRQMGAADASPVMEAIQVVMASGNDTPPVQHRFQELDKHLIIISDMLQNVPGKYSHYKNHKVFSNWAKDNQYLERLAVDLKNTSITVHYIDRPKARRHQGLWHKKFWVDYFAKFGAGQVSFKPLQ